MTYATDLKGNYVIKNVPKNAIFVFSYIGMTTQEVRTGSKTVVNARLESSAERLDKAIVVGYGTTSKESLTGAVTSISSKQLENEPVVSVAQALQGKSAGLQILSTGGRAGDATQISLRGNGSLRASNDVLYVIDGIPQEDMSSVSPADIKTISVLKDAASAAIYGSRASNGVILIETNKGYFNQKTVVSVNSSYGFQNLVKKPNMLNAAQYKQVLDVARVNYQNDISAGLLKGPKDPSSLTPLPASKYDTDWFDLILNDNAAVQNHQISVSGGGENTKAYISGALYKQDGIVKQDSYKRARVRANIEQKVNNFISIGLRGYFTYSESTPIVDDNNTYQPYHKALEARPDVHPWDKDGKIQGFGFINPLYAFERYVLSNSQNTGGTFYFDVKPVEGLVWHSAYSGNITSGRYNRFDAPNTKRGLNGDGVPTGYGYYSTSNTRDYQIENTITYDRNFFGNRLKTNILVGHSYQNWAYEDSYVSGEKFPSNDLRWLVSAGEINKGRSYIKEMSLESYFSRLTLNWEDKYYLMISMRADGSSKFTEENRWGTFPATSIGWTISNESFFDVDWVDMLKLRASFGYTGNQTGISYATGQNLIGSGQNYDQDPGLATTDIFNPNLKWEKGKSLNIGIDFDFLNRFNLTFDYYNKETIDLLYRINVPQESGYRTMLANVGTISNKGFEFGLNSQILKDTEVKWDFGFNFSYNKNEVVKIGTKQGYYNTGFVSRVEEGKSLGSFSLYEVQGIASEKYTYKDKDGKAGQTVAAGDMIYVDQNKDGKIGDEDKKTFEGGIAPIYGGFNTRVEYKGFDLSISGQYSLGKKVYAFFKKDVLNGGNVGAPSYAVNMITDMLDYWTTENKGAANPRPHLSSQISSWNLEHSTRFLENADYLRIQDITLGYTIKGIERSNLNFIKSLRIYVQARNIFTFTKYSTGDPEVYYVDQNAENSQDRSDGSKIGAGVDLGGIPNTKSIMFGINIKF